MKTFIVRRISFKPNREEGRPRVINCQTPEEALKMANVLITGSLSRRADGVYQADTGFNFHHMTSDIVEVIPS